MRRATSILAADHWANDEVMSTVTLSFADRFRRRIKMTDDEGTDFLLDLADAVQLGEGDALLLEEGGLIAVRAADEDVLDIQCESKVDTARIAWHIGNRHLPTQVLDDGTLRIRADHVIAQMLVRLGAEVEAKVASFDPEPGAYDEGAGHSHGDGHDH